jgi:hypothetical protein
MASLTEADVDALLRRLGERHGSIRTPKVGSFMKRVHGQLRRRRAQVAAHSFFVWLNSDAAPIEQRFVFAPVMIDFIMGFADMNKWFLSYPEPKDEHERAINEHTEEDRTHSRLFYENWYTLALGDPAKWAPGKMLWWLFHSADTAVVRRFGMELLDLAVRYGDPLVRFSLMEAVEVCGDVFFANTAPIAEAISARHGSTQRYFGQYHRVRETGHLHADETVFLATRLTDEQARQSTLVIDRVFDTFLLVLDRLVSYSRRATSHDDGLASELDDEYQLALEVSHASSAVFPTRPWAPSSAVSNSQSPALRTLNEHLHRLEEHPFLGWLREEGAVAPRATLQSFVALWGVDITGYKDFNELVLRYKVPQSPMEHGINRWTEELATHSALYLQDWRSLGMDHLLGWDAGETIAFYFLGAQTEVHRRNMAKVKHYAFAHTNAVLRWWLIKALESSGDPLFTCTTPIAEAAEREHGIALDYWANRHSLSSALRAGPEDDVPFVARDISSDQCAIICEMIGTVFDNIGEQLSLSHQVAAARLFVREPSSLPPAAPRHSMIVAIAPGGPARAEWRTG